MADEKITVRVFRFDPSKDKTHRYETYEVPWREGMTVLEVLYFLYVNASLAFRYSCRSGMCGSCGVMLNGKAVLACRTNVESRILTLEPLKGFPVIRDLVVDTDQMVEKALETRPWVIRSRLQPKELEKIPSAYLSKFFEAATCGECYLCYATCPVIQVANRKEYGGPKIFVRDIGLRLFDPRDEGSLDRLKQAVGALELYDCTTCRACHEVCPKEINISDHFVEPMRAKAVEVGLGPLEGHKVFIENIRKTGRSVSVKDKSLLKMLPEVVDIPDPVDTVTFFTGCLMDYRLQNVGLSLVEVMKQNQIRVIIPKDQSCCASPAFRIGVLDLAEEQVRKNVEVLERYRVEKVVVGCAGCGATLKNNFPQVMERLRGEKPRYTVYDMAEYIKKFGLEKFVKRLGEVPMSVTYHDPCHLNRGQGVRDEPRDLIKRIPGVKFVEMEGADICCGAGGGCRSGLRELSMAIGKAKVESIKKAGVEACVTECPFCHIQIKELLEQYAPEVDAIYLPELLLMAYRGCQRG